jgi:hypothetical protein
MRTVSQAPLMTDELPNRVLNTPRNLFLDESEPSAGFVYRCI